MPNVYALASHPVAQRAIQLAQEEHKTKGFRAVFGVILMFTILAGGVWMLLQSSFGPKQAYLISGTAFWGCWLVLSVIWLTGVPGVSVIGIPRSTPQYYGPQGEEARWIVADADHPDAAKKVAEFEHRPGASDSDYVLIDESIPSGAAQTESAAAQAAAQEVISEAYAVELGVGASDVTVPTVVNISEVRLARVGGQYRYAKVTFDAAQPNATDTPATKALIGRIKPKTVELWLNAGSLATPTYYAIALFFVLFIAHAALLTRYELNRLPEPQGAPERVPASV